ncbi:MAG: PadR family transcriptional regulator [Acidimicrobiales bacterium]
MPKDRITPSPVKWDFDLLLLAVLQDGSNHGYAVMAALKERSDGAFDLPEGTVYPALHRLEHQGLLRSTWESVNGRRRRIYQLTATGARALAGGRSRWASFVTAVDSVLSPSAPRLA